MSDALLFVEKFIANFSRNLILTTFKCEKRGFNTNVTYGCDFPVRTNSELLEREVFFEGAKTMVFKPLLSGGEQKNLKTMNGF